MASDANLNALSDLKLTIKPDAPSAPGIVPAPAAQDGFFAQVSGNPFFTAVHRNQFLVMEHWLTSNR